MKLLTCSGTHGLIAKGATLARPGYCQDGDSVDEGGVVAAGAVQSLERDRVRPGGDGERGGRVDSGTTCRRA